jgi:GntR family transcriptional regulator, arabinose operon transcriptional repressor
MSPGVHINDGKAALAKYPQVVEELKLAISSGRLRPGDRVPSRAELQSEYAISRVTVERVYDALQQQGLIVREQGRGTFVAPQDKRTATGVIGCYGIDFSIQQLSYYVHLMRGVQSAAGAAGIEILLLNPGVRSVQWEKLDGVLLCGPSDSIRPHLPVTLPSVSLLYPVPERSSVIGDDYAGMKAATEYLIALGHRKIAYLIEQGTLTEPRMRGYRDALSSADIKFDRRWVHKLMPQHEEEFKGRGRETMVQWMGGNWKQLGCTALLCQNDRTAVGVMQALEAAKVKVPRDLSVVGFDGTDECEQTTPRLTSVQLPLEEIGATGFRLLLAEMKDEKAQQQTLVLPTMLRTGGTTGHPR